MAETLHFSTPTRKCNARNSLELYQSSKQRDYWALVGELNRSGAVFVLYILTILPEEQQRTVCSARCRAGTTLTKKEVFGLHPWALNYSFYQEGIKQLYRFGNGCATGLLACVSHRASQAGAAVGSAACAACMRICSLRYVPSCLCFIVPLISLCILFAFGVYE